jgi:hypothetical protein
MPYKYAIAYRFVKNEGGYSVLRINQPAVNRGEGQVFFLTVSGISKDNATADCQVYVIADNLRPYQNASGDGPDGKNDYSRWNFILTSKYTLIKEGVNKITAKFSCKPNPAIAAFYSINVTGIAGTTNQSGATSNNSTRNNATIVSDFNSTKGSKL